MFTKLVQVASSRLASLFANDCKPAATPAAPARPVARAGLAASLACLGLLLAASVLATGCDESSFFDTGSSYYPSYSDTGGDSCEFYSSGSICGGYVDFYDSYWKGKHADAGAAATAKARR